MMLKRIFGPQGKEVAGGWNTMHNDGLHESYVSRNIRVIISRKMRWEMHVDGKCI
jgi:hypothetical protein